jgi:GNAT superfamily N-acetyltransferase
MYDYIVLDNSKASAYKHLTDFWFQEYLERLSSPNATAIAIGVVLKEQPVGLILAGYRKGQHRANILSLFISPKHRRQGLGTALLIQIEEILQVQGCQQIDFMYNLNLTTSVLERMLDRQGWSTGFPYSLQCMTNIEILGQAPFLNRYTLPQKYTIFDWTELTDREKNTIQRRERGLNYPDELSPFQEGRILAPASIGVRDRDGVVGWSIVEQATSNCVIYNSLFVKPEVRSIGLGIHVLAASINRQVVCRKSMYAVCIVLQENTAMIAFMRRHLSPYLTAMNSCWKSSKFNLSERSPVNHHAKQTCI